MPEQNPEAVGEAASRWDGPFAMPELESSEMFDVHAGPAVFEGADQSNGGPRAALENAVPFQAGGALQMPELENADRALQAIPDSLAPIRPALAPRYAGLSNRDVARMIGPLPATLALHDMLCSPGPREATLAALLGAAGRHTVRVGEQEVPVAQYLQTLADLCQGVAASCLAGDGAPPNAPAEPLSREAWNGEAWNGEAAGSEHWTASSTGGIADNEEETGPSSVRWLQAALNGAIGAGLKVDGLPGPRTTDALRRFQRSRGLVADGLVGPRTLAALRGVSAAPAGSLLTSGPSTACKGLPERHTISGFAFNRAEVPASAESDITNTAACVLASQRSSTPIRSLKLVGHTDTVGTDADNDALGLHRAEAVRDQLFAALTRLSGHPPGLVVAIDTRGKREEIPGDAASNRRVEIIAPFAFPLVDPPKPPIDPAEFLRARLSASLLLAANPNPQAAPFTADAVRSGRRSGNLWSYDLHLAEGSLEASDVTCVVPHPGIGSHPMTVLKQVRWSDVSLQLDTGARATLPLDARFLLGSFEAIGGALISHAHPIWRLASRLDVGSAVVFAYDITKADNPLPIRDVSQLRPSNAQATPAMVWVLVCCELVLCKALNDFEPAGALEAARVYPLIEILSNVSATTTQGSVTLRRPATSAMDHHWAPGARHLVAMFADRNSEQGIVEALMALTGKTGRLLPTWDNLFDYADKDAAATTRTVKVVDPSRTGSRPDVGLRQTLDRLQEIKGPTAVLKLPRQGDFDNIHLAPQMQVSLSLPIGGAVIPPTPVSMAPICAHDCFHMHWRWSQHFTTESTAGWGPGPNDAYTVAGAPMVRSNITVSLVLTAGVPGLVYQASAAAQPANDWMVVMHHGAAYAIRLHLDPASVVEMLLARTALPQAVREVIVSLMAKSEDDAFAWLYFFLQFWPALRSRPLLRPLPVIDGNLARLMAL